jgi:phenylalanyl-tRNA synthetase alpha chain
VREMLENICKQALDSIAEAKQSNDLEAIRVKYLGKKGQLTQILRGMGKLSPEERPVMGQLANQVRGDIESALSSRVKEMEEMTLAKRLREETIDVTLPGKRPPLGGLHPLTTVLNQVTDVFLGWLMVKSYQ